MTGPWETAISLLISLYLKLLPFWWRRAEKNYHQSLLITASRHCWPVFLFGTSKSLLFHIMLLKRFRSALLVNKGLALLRSLGYTRVKLSRRRRGLWEFRSLWCQLTQSELSWFCFLSAQLVFPCNSKFMEQIGFSWAELSLELLSMHRQSGRTSF